MQKEYDKIVLLYDLQHRWERYQSFLKLKKYDFALNELLLGYGLYDSKRDTAKELGVEKQYDDIAVNIKQALSDKYNVSSEKAIEVYKISNRKRFTIACNKILVDAKLDKASKYKK
jgi:hypothetical protein